MKTIIVIFLAAILNMSAESDPLKPNAMDTYKTDTGIIEVQHLGHGSVLIKRDGDYIYFDPYSKAYDFTGMPKADLILITHDHSDHLDPAALKIIVKEDTHIISNTTAAEKLNRKAEILRNGDKTSWKGIGIEAVPAYNIVNMREPGAPYHPKGEGNGYVLSIGGLRIYVAGDTELIPEMKSLGAIDIAFLPKNLPYTMTDEMFVEAAKTVKPKVLYPYHYFEADKKMLQEKLSSMVIK